MTDFDSGDNFIHPSAEIYSEVKLGRFNSIGRGVVIAAFKGGSSGPIQFGDCNIIHDYTRILVGPGGIAIGDWNVFHNNMLVVGGQGIRIGHNCWFGQNTILDGSGGLHVGNGVRVGMYSQLWTHVASGELIEGCTLFAHRATTIEDDVWLVGSCIVSSGVTVGRRTVCLIGSNVTKDTLRQRVYAGSPARLMESMSAYRPVDAQERLRLMTSWLEDFRSRATGSDSLVIDSSTEFVRIATTDRRDCLVFTLGEFHGHIDPHTSYFDLLAKSYRKRLSELERSVYRYLYDHKARFLPEHSSDPQPR
jgi:acetyltransferase-like isoleucine patch superfamily enzyme